MAAKSKLRCAIYTRKSSEEGLDQSFNSLDAQREACEAYIKSQAHEGWAAIATHYDDGGYSGGTIERPALKRLLADLARGVVDTIVVYKVDRLTRSLADFAKIVEILDGQGASFVSITQQFNTTTSMGRLTLNVLLSFAQFEREVTGERIRDKIAASKKKGMWMGGYAPMGYDVHEQCLVVNEAEAEQVRQIYRRYLEVGSVGRLQGVLEQEGLRSKFRRTKAGRTLGASSFSRGALRHLLQNRTYRGQIIHGDKTYPGLHEAIVPEELWERVQTVLAASGAKQAGQQHSSSYARLTGVIFDDGGNAMSPSHTQKANGRRYRYYVSQALLQGRPNDAGSVSRVAAPAVENLVGDTVKYLVPTRSLDVDRIRPSASSNRPVLQRIVIAGDSVSLTFGELKTDHRLAWKLPTDVRVIAEDENSVTVQVPIRLGRSSRSTRIDTPGTHVSRRPRFDPALIKAAARAYRWRQALISGAAQSLEEIAKQEGCKDRYVRYVLNLAFLAPDITEAILAGTQPAALTVTRILCREPPLSWRSQRHIYPVSQAAQAEAIR
jgi:site-specific DNA recombinase